MELSLMKNPRARLGGMGSGGWLSLAGGLACGVASVAHAGVGSINVVALNVGVDDRAMVPGAPGLAFQSVTTSSELEAASIVEAKANAPSLLMPMPRRIVAEVVPLP